MADFGNQRFEMLWVELDSEQTRNGLTSDWIVFLTVAGLQIRWGTRGAGSQQTGAKPECPLHSS